MRFGLLGPLEVVDADGARRDPAAARQRCLLAALLVWRGEHVSVDRLVDVLWADGELPKDPAGAVRTYVTRLRTALEPERVGGQPRIVTGGPDWYVLDIAGHDVDADAFERDLEEATALLDGDPETALACLERGLGRWRGPALADVGDELWARPEVERLDALRVIAEEHRLRCLIDLGAIDEAITGLQHHIHAHPLSERPNGLLMLALDRAGRTAEASAVFHGFRERLGEETGLDPSDDLEQLHLRLLSRSDATTFAILAPGRWDRIPLPRLPLLGRDRDIAAVWQLLATRRLVTVVGPGGVGKTRLAAELAYRTREAGGEVVVAELGGVSEPHGVVDAVFDALELPAVGRRHGINGLSRLLRSHRARLVIDNCEHLIEPVAELLRQLTRELPELTILATSREPLGIDGEHVHRLPSLDESAAVALFRERALAAGFVGPFEPVDDEPIRQVCRWLDGIPLAIEFAAAAASSLGVAEVAARLDDRLWAMGTGRRTLDRHETLEAAIGWSYELLDGDERAVLRAAAAFVNGFTVEGLAHVAMVDEDPALGILMSLIRKSLVEAKHDAAGRYRLLETVRLFALKRAHEHGDAVAAQERHAEHFVARALEHAPHIHDLPPGVDRSMCRIRLHPKPDTVEADLPNHLAVLRWLEHTGELVTLGRLAARMSTVLGHTGFLDPDGRFLGRDDVAAVLSDLPAELALYHLASSLNDCCLGYFGDALRAGRSAMSAAVDPATRSAAAALTALASTGLEPDRVGDLVAGALEEAPSDARFTRLLLRGQRTLSLIMEDRLEEAVDNLEPHVRLGDAFAAAEQLVVLHVLGQDERAVQLPIPGDAHPEAAALWSYRWPLVHGLAHAAAGDHEAARKSLHEATERVTTSPLDHEHDVLIGCAALAYHAGEPRRALQLLDTVGRRVISPSAFALAGHYRRLAEAALEPGQRASTTELGPALDPHEVLRTELQALTAMRSSRQCPHSSARC